MFHFFYIVILLKYLVKSLINKSMYIYDFMLKNTWKKLWWLLALMLQAFFVHLYSRGACPIASHFITTSVPFLACIGSGWTRILGNMAEIKYYVITSCNHINGMKYMYWYVNKYGTLAGSFLSYPGYVESSIEILINPLITIHNCVCVNKFTNNYLAKMINLTIK